MKKSSSWILGIVLVCLWGGIYDFTVFLYGICFAVGLFMVSKSNREIMIIRNRSTIAFLLMILGAVVSTFAARDKGMAFIGLLRILVFFLFWVLWNNIKKETKEHFWQILTDLVALITVGCMCCYFIPAARTYVFHAGRLGGILQYSNTYAMLLLILLIGLFYEKRETWKGLLSYIEAGIFIAGIIWCQSRSVLVLFAAAILFLLVKKRKQIQWKWVAVLCICLGVLVGISVLVMDYDLSRLLKFTLSSSTFNGRLLYAGDAGKQLISHPAGLGYMGYYFAQPQFQTGNYITKYVHNDILQLGLDGGWLALAGILILFLGNIFSKKNTEKNRVILLLLFLHILFDFDLQYGLMFCMLIMCLDTTGEKEWKLKKTYSYGIAAVTLAVCGYFSIAFGSSYFGNQKLAVAMYPGNTFAWEEQISGEDDIQSAERIIKQNGMLASAYEQKAASMISDGSYEEASKAIEQMLERAGYQSYYYNQAVYELSYCLQAAVQENDMEQAQKYLTQIQKIPEQIEQKKKQASMFAWRINDSPEIELEDSISTYIENLKDVTLE